MFDDFTPRYVPEVIFTAKTGDDQVKRITGYDPGKHPKESPIIKTVSAIKVETVHGGVRWFGVSSYKINSELRMVITGINSNDYVRRTRWLPCRIP